MSLRQVLVLDGGVSERLAELVTEACGRGLHPQLWSAALLHPRGIPGAPAEAIQTVHHEFLQAGADIITTVGYQATVPGFKSAGLAQDDEEAAALVRSSIEEASRAVEDYLQKAPSKAPADGKSVAGEGAGRHPILAHAESVGPVYAASFGSYGAFLHDGSEYRGTYDITNDALKEHHKRTLDALLGGDTSNHSVIVAFETVPVLREAIVLAEIMRECYPSTPFWISFQCGAEAKTAAGNTLADCCDALMRICGPDASPLDATSGVTKHCAEFLGVGVNCCSPQDALHAVAALRSVLPPTLEVVVYPNSGEVFCGVKKTWQLPADAGDVQQRSIVEWAVEYARAGATIIGGCCRVSPGDIAAIRDALTPQQDTGDQGGNAS